MQMGFPKKKKGGSPPVDYVDGYLSKRAMAEAKQGIFPDYREPSSAGLPKLSQGTPPMKMTTCFLAAKLGDGRKRV